MRLKVDENLPVEAAALLRREGFIVLRLKRQSRAHVLAVLDRLLHTLSDHLPQQQLWIVDEDRIRIRS